MLTSLALAMVTSLCVFPSDARASLEEKGPQDSRWQYALLVLPGGEGQIDYLLIQVASKDSVLEGQAFYLSHAHDSLPFEQLTLKDIIQRLNEGAGVCVRLKGNRRAEKWTLESEEVLIQKGSSRWRYKWTITGNVQKSAVEWKVHEDYWFGGYEHFPEDYSVQASLLNALPVPLQERRNCLPASTGP